MIDDCIVDLHKTLKDTGSDSIFDSVIYRRLLILSVIANISDINSKLKKLSEDLNTSIDIEAKEIDYDLFLKDTYWKDCWILDDYDYPNKDADNDSFDEIASYLPCEGTGHTIMPESVESFKTGLHLLCDSDRMSEHDLKYALHNCFREMKSLLNEVRDKSKRAEASMYANFWDDTYVCYEKEPVLAKYNNWKDETGDIDFKKLKDKQTQELVKVLTSGFLDFRPMPTNGEINRCKLVIDEDALTAGFVLPNNIKELCARFEYFMSWKDKEHNIIALDYVKLGKYLYEHHGLIWVKTTAIIYFDIILDAIQKDMAEKKPQLKPYLKGYEEYKAKVLLEEWTPILDTCQKHLAKDIMPTFLQNYLRKLIFDKEMRDEVRKKLSSASRYTYICEMVAALKNSKVFKDECSKHDLAKSLSEKITDVLVETLAKNIERKYNANDGALYHWTKKNVEDLKAQTQNLHKGDDQ